MHFHSLAVLRIPEIQEDAEEDARIEKELAEMEQMEDQGPQNIMRSVMIRELRGLLNSFSREVYRLIQDLMHPYGRAYFLFNDGNMIHRNQSGRIGFLNVTRVCDFNDIANLRFR